MRLLFFYKTRLRLRLCSYRKYLLVASLLHIWKSKPICRKYTLSSQEIGKGLSMCIIENKNESCKF